jgi:hypothetical protein
LVPFEKSVIFKNQMVVIVLEFTKLKMRGVMKINPLKMLMLSLRPIENDNLNHNWINPKQRFVPVFQNK